MKFVSKKVSGLLCVLCVLGGESLCFSLDREAFSITNYDLNLQIEPDQHRLGARGKITLRNDTATPQKIAVLQISSSLDWRSVKTGDKAVQFVRQPYTSDIDHTGALSEAIVTLPQEVAPHGTIDLDIGYEGVILLDATRLTRIGTPDDVAKHSDWDQIDENFTGLRGAGYVAWYPIATDVANLSEGDSVSEVLERWKGRQKGSKVHLQIFLHFVNPKPTILFGGIDCDPLMWEQTSSVNGLLNAECKAQSLRLDFPTLLVARYGVTEKRVVEVRFLPNHDAAAAKFADTSENTASLVQEWFGLSRENPKVADLPDPDATPFESGSLLVIPLASLNSNSDGLAAAHQLTHASFLSFRPWIEEGLAHFAQALFLEQIKGRQAALDYMGVHRTILNQIEPKETALDSAQDASRSLVSTVNDQLYRSKAMCVWWMLRDMIGDAALKKAIAAYKAEDDKDSAYMQRLIAAQTQRDLQWFFDDWVYHDRGLPDFKVESAFASKTPSNGFMLTITLDNLGTAGAEVPVNIKLATGEVTKRIEVRAKGKTTVRLETPSVPQEIRVNDGSVPESNPVNNVFKVEPPKS
jgi:peptidase M1-like protein